MTQKITIEGGVEIEGLSKVEDINTKAYDGITVTLQGAVAENLKEIKVRGGATEKNPLGVRRIIWKGEISGVNRSAVLIVNTDNGFLRGSWLFNGTEENVMSYYTEVSEMGEEDKAEITMTFESKEAALKPRTFTFMEKYSLLSLGSSFDHVTVEAGKQKDIYISRTNEETSKINGVIKNKTKAQINNGNWKFDSNESFIVETKNNAIKFYNGRQ